MKQSTTHQQSRQPHANAPAPAAALARSQVKYDLTVLAFPGHVVRVALIGDTGFPRGVYLPCTEDGATDPGPLLFVDADTPLDALEEKLTRADARWAEHRAAHGLS